jgi:diacylglycerol O-acyltransferase
MNHLSGMDASFLYLESPEMPMHVGSMQILDLPAGYDGDFYEDAKRYLAQRLHLADVFQRKLELMPFELANPVWVDEDDLDLDYHVRHVILPRPGTREQLERYVARLHSSLLDRSRPLWEIYVIEGLNTGQVVLYNKMHHATIDGQAGVAVNKALLTPTATPDPVKKPRSRKHVQRAQVGMAELAGAGASNAVQQLVKLVRALPSTARTVAGVFFPKSEEDGKRRFVAPEGWLRAPRTQLNVAVTNQRAFAARSLPLAEIKGLAKATGASLNDVVLAICAGALRRYLLDYDGLPAKPLIAAVPVSLREAGNTDSNNQVTMMLVSLATDVEDPLARLAAIHASANVGKKFTGSIKAAIPMDFPSFGAPWLMSGLASLYGRSRLADRLPPIVNVAISNVPGPQLPLYFAGARLAEWYPVSIPGHGVALNMTVQSYNGAVEFGLTACRRAVPDITDLGDYVVEEHRKLVGLLERAAVAAVAPAPIETVQAAPAKRARAARPRKRTAVSGTKAAKPLAH